MVIFVAADYSASYYTTGGFILYLQDSNSTTLSGGLFFAKATKKARPPISAAAPVNLQVSTLNSIMLNIEAVSSQDYIRL